MEEKRLSHIDQPVEYIRYLMLLTKNRPKPEISEQISMAMCYMLCKTNGLINLVNASIDLDDTSQKVTTYNQRFEALATVVSGLPKLDRSLEQYYESICFQLIQFLVQKQKYYQTDNLSVEVKNQLKTLAVTILRALLKRRRQIFFKIFLKPLFVCLREGQTTYQINSNQSELANQKLIYSDEQVSSSNEINSDQVIKIEIHDSLEIINTLICRQFPWEFFVKQFQIIFYFKVLLHGTPSHLNTVTRTILEELLSRVRHSHFLLDDTLFSNQMLEQLKKYQVVIQNRTITIKPLNLDPEQESKQASHQDQLTQIDKIVQSCSQLIRPLSIDKTIDLFLTFLQRLLNSKNWDQGDPRLLILCSVIDTLQEQVLPAIVDLPTKAIQFINSTLERIANNYEIDQKTQDIQKHAIDSEESMQNSIDHDSLLMCLQLIENLVDKKLNNEEQNAICQSLTSLADLSKKCQKSDNQLSARINNLRCKLMAKSIKSDYERCEDKDYEQAIKDLNSHLMPDRAHALITLKKLIEQRNRNVIQHQDQLILVLKGSLADNESYIYLAAINTLSLLAVVDTGQVLPILIKEFLDENRSIEERTRIGQCMVNLSKQFGDLAPAYAPKIMHALLRSTRSKEPQIRVSSISNVGEFCANLRFSLTNYLIELMSCLENLFKTDDCIEVRRACVMFFHLLFNNLCKDDLVCVQDIIVQVYRLLKMSYQNTLDDIIRLHSQLALEQLNRIAKELLQLDTLTQNAIKL